MVIVAVLYEEFPSRHRNVSTSRTSHLLENSYAGNPPAK